MEERIATYFFERKKDIERLEVKPRLISVRLTKDFITSVIGPRRAGKTYFLYYLIKNKKIKEEDYLFVNFEEIEGKIEQFIKKHIEVYGKLPSFVFFDEIQNLPNWEKEVYRLFERKKFYIFVTGSSSKLLSKEIATQLRGRAFPVKIFPFSFEEILLIEGLRKEIYTSEEEGKIKKLLSSSLKYGCFPDIVLKKIDAPAFFSEYIDVVIYKDIMERFGIKNRVALEFFVKNSVSSNSKIFSINKIYNTLKSLGIRVSKNTLYNFQKYLEDISLFFFVKKFSFSVRKIELSLPKIYVVDNGLYFFLTYKYDMGRLLESFVLQELVKRGFDPSKNLFYLKINDKEVDFLIKEGLRIKQLIQVTYASSLDEIERREIKALTKAYDLFKKDRPELIIITWDLEDILKVNNKEIKLIPLWKWLLAKSERFP